MLRRARGAVVVCVAGVLVLSGCTGGPESSLDTANEAGGPSSEASATAQPHDAGTPVDATIAVGDESTAPSDTCEWEAAPLAASATAPTGKEGPLDALIIGAWQHTHYDDGGGYVAVDKDIRYVFPSPAQLLYCQHVPGVTDHAENRAEITWDGDRIVLPGGAPGYVVEAWDADAMVWINRLDDSRYLLQRR